MDTPPQPPSEQTIEVRLQRAAEQMDSLVAGVRAVRDTGSDGKARRCTSRARRPLRARLRQKREADAALLSELSRDLDELDGGEPCS